MVMQQLFPLSLGGSSVLPDAAGDNGITWIATPSRGSALCDRGSQRDGLIISSPVNQPLWVYLSIAAMAINFGETSEVIKAYFIGVF